MLLLRSANLRRDRRRASLALVVAAALLLAAAACGGNDEETVTIHAGFSGAERDAFRAVLDRFEEQNADVKVNDVSVRNPRRALGASLEKGDSPDLAVLESPLHVKELAAEGILRPVEFARTRVEREYAREWLDVATVDRKLYGVFVKGVNKSIVWYNVQAFYDADVEPPESWEALLDGAMKLRASGIPAYSIAGADPWTLADLFENVYLRTAGPQSYERLARHAIPWTDASVKEALSEVAKILGDRENIAGGVRGALETDFPTSVLQAFIDPPEAVMVFAGDFTHLVIRSVSHLEPGDGFDVFAFPSIRSSRRVVIGTGDVAVMLRDTPVARALIRYLASADAGEVWANWGGFSSPNKRVPARAYPDDISRGVATELADAEVRYDLSELQAEAFGKRAMPAILQRFLRHPTDVDGTARRLEAAAVRALER